MQEQGRETDRETGREHAHTGTYSVRRSTMLASHHSTYLPTSSIFGETPEVLTVNRFCTERGDGSVTPQPGSQHMNSRTGAMRPIKRSVITSTAADTFRQLYSGSPCPMNTTCTHNVGHLMVNLAHEATILRLKRGRCRHRWQAGSTQVPASQSGAAAQFGLLTGS